MAEAISREGLIQGAGFDCVRRVCVVAGIGPEGFSGTSDASRMTETLPGAELPKRIPPDARSKERRK